MRKVRDSFMNEDGYLLVAESQRIMPQESLRQAIDFPAPEATPSS